MPIRSRATSVVLASSFLLLLVPAASPENGDAGYRVVEGWPQLPEGFAFGDVAGVDVDSHNHVWVFHRGNRDSIACFDGDTGEMLGSFGEGMFENAHGLTVDRDDNLWVTDTRRHQVFKFSHGGELLMTLGEEGVAGWDAAHFNQPTDVAVAPDGTFYVSDGYGNSRVAKFAADGTFLMDWGRKGKRPGEFDLPHGLALDDAGKLYVADRTNQRIQIFNSDGELLRLWGAEQLGRAGRPWGLDVSSDGFLFVIDGGDMNEDTPDHAQVVQLDLEGNVIRRWGSYGTAPGQFLWGHDIAAGEDGAVYTVDVRDNDWVQKFVRR